MNWYWVEASELEALRLGAMSSCSLKKQADVPDRKQCKKNKKSRKNMS